MLPLVGTLAPPNKRATALSIVVSGLMLGLLMARLLSGIIANYSSWRNVYWMSFALQYSILILLWIWMPDYPQSNKNISYFRILFSILELLVKHPVLVQASIIAFLNSSCFTSFWTTLTFLLSGDPYNYSTVIIGLFALCGMGPMFFGPLFANRFIDRFPIHVSVLVGIFLSLIGIVVGTYTGEHHVAGPIIQAILFDFGSQITQIANRTAIYGVAPKAASRVNTAFMVFSFCGQLTGTAVGNKVYAQGGWIRSGSVSVGFMGGATVILLLRGPMETRWFGWRGGLGPNRKDIVAGKNGNDEEKQQPQQSTGKDSPVGQSDSEKTVVDDNRGSPENEQIRALGQSKEHIHQGHEEQHDKADHTEISEEKNIEGTGVKI
jgi:predicted MFS family arabinose efflux permease